MGNFSLKSTLLLNLALTAISLLLLLTIVESRGSNIGHIPPKESLPRCDSVYGVKSGDTCFAITEEFKLTTPFFQSLNPNLKCTALFIGQWLCVNGAS